MSDISCSIQPLKKNQRRGTLDECIKKRQIRYYGIEKVDMSQAKKAKPGKNELTRDKIMAKISALRGKVKNLTSKMMNAKKEDEKEQFKSELNKATNELTKYRELYAEIEKKPKGSTIKIEEDTPPLTTEELLNLYAPKGGAKRPIEAKCFDGYFMMKKGELNNIVKKIDSSIPVSKLKKAQLLCLLMKQAAQQPIRQETRQEIKIDEPLMEAPQIIEIEEPQMEAPQMIEIEEPQMEAPQMKAPQMEAPLSNIEPILYIPPHYKNGDTLIYFHRLFKDLTDAYEYVKYGIIRSFFKEKHRRELEKWMRVNYDFYRSITQRYLDARDRDANFNLTEQQKFNLDDKTNNIIDSMPLADKDDEIHWGVQNRYERSPSEKIAYYIDLLSSLDNKNYAKRDIRNIIDKIKELEQKPKKGPIIKKKLQVLSDEFEVAKKIEPSITADLQYQKRYLQHRIKNMERARKSGSGKDKIDLNKEYPSSCFNDYLNMTKGELNKVVKRINKNIEVSKLRKPEILCLLMELQKDKVYMQPLAQKNNEAKLRREQQEQEFNDKIRELERSRLERLKKNIYGEGRIKKRKNN